MIELLVVISILAVMAMLSYTGYLTQQQIVRVRLAVKEVSQAIHEARNMAINGYVDNPTDQKNQSVGIYFKKDENVMKFYKYNHDEPVPILENAYLLYERPLQNGVLLGEISGKENTMLFFSAITGEKKFYTFSGGYATRIDPIPEKVELSVSYKNIPVAPFFRKVTYFPKTNVVDY